MAVGVLFLAVNILGRATLHGARLDLTENKLYTLSQGSRNIASKVDEPITLTLYYSEKASTDFPQFKSYATRVREVLREYEGASGGKVSVRLVDPEPFSEAEDAAVQAGLAGMPSGRGTERFYFGLVGENSTDKREMIPIFDPSKEEFLEYDLTRIVYLLSNPQKKAIGIMAQLPVEGMKDYPLARGQNIPSWQFVNALHDFFEVKTIAPDKPEIPADLKVLVLIHPKNLSDKGQYAVDQFVLNGGNLLVFVDPWCEADLPPGVDPMRVPNMPRNSDLKKLFDAWGIELVPEKIAADRGAALRVNGGSDRSPEPVLYLPYLGLSKANLSSSEPVTGQLDRINVGMAGVLRKRQGATIQFDPLMETGTDSMLMDVKEVQFMPDPKKLLSEFVPGGQKLTIAARLTGKVPTAFPAGDPAKPPESNDAPKPEDAKAEHLTESKGEAHIIVVADCDMLGDRLWVQEARLGNISLGFNKFADNGDFVVAAVDNLSGSSDLISLRARGKFQRPFDRVETIQKEADTQYLAKEQELRAKLTKAQTQIDDLMKQKPEGGAIILTQEQQASIDGFRTEMIKTRKELREIQFQRNKDIEKLGSELKFLNIGLMPVLVGVGAVGLSLYRANRKRAWARGIGSRS